MSDIDVQHAGILQEILRFVSMPKTVEEVANEFNWHPQTARRYLWELKAMGKVKECFRKKERKKLWQTSASLGASGELLLVTQSGTFPMSAFLAHVDTRKPLGNIMAECLAYLWRRAYYKAQDQSEMVNVIRQGALDPLIDVRRVMDETYRQYSRFIDALEQMLVDIPEMWQDSGAILNMLGPNVQRERMEELAHEFDVWASGVLEALKQR